MKQGALACLILVVINLANADDRILDPPAREIYLSPNGNYELIIAMVGENKDWSHNGSTGTLVSKFKDTTEIRWEKTLPHQYRPRYAVVNDVGQTVLLDQWINVAGPYAVTVFDQTGSTVAEYDFRAIAKAVGVQGREVVRQAKYGAWMSTQPTLDPGGVEVSVGVGGKTLVINTSDGQIGIRQ